MSSKEIIVDYITVDGDLIRLKKSDLDLQASAEADTTSSEYQDAQLNLQDTLIEFLNNKRT